MAQFRATIQGNRGITSRCGSKNSGMTARINGWNFGVTVTLHHNEQGDDEAIVRFTKGSNGGSYPVVELPPVDLSKAIQMAKEKA